MRRRKNMNNCWEWFIVVLVLIGLVLFLVAMFMNYNLTLGARTAKLEKKNGKELAELAKVNKRLDRLEAKQGGKDD